MNRIREMIEIVREEVTAPGINQRRGNWNDQRDCCMGSRIGHALGLPPGSSYLEGIDEWDRMMGINRARVIAMLQDAGAGRNPLGTDHWPERPAAVWWRLEELEEAPSLAGRDLRRLNLAGSDLKGENLQETLLDACNLEDALLNNSDLSFSRMRGVNLRNARIRCVNLTGADLSQADLTGADLAKSNLRGTNLDGASLALAKLEQTRLARLARTRRLTNP